MPSDPLPSNRNLPRRPDPVALVWIGGIALAGLAYAVGPDHFVGSALAALERAGWYVDDMVRNLTATAFEAMRAGAIGLLGVFIALSLLNIRRSGHGRLALVVVTALFLMLVWGAYGDSPAANTRWLAALLLSGFSAIAATNRLIHAGNGQGGWHLGAPPR